MIKKIKTPKSFTGVLPEICDFERGVRGENFSPNPLISSAQRIS